MFFKFWLHGKVKIVAWSNKFIILNINILMQIYVYFSFPGNDISNVASALWVLLNKKNV